MNTPGFPRFALASLVFWAFIACAINPAHAAPGDEDFRQGIADFHAAKHEQALKAFLSAREKGLSSAQLTYDLGVTYYHLGRYAESAREFEALAAIPAESPLAHYNLGLVARKTGRDDQAQREFDTAYRTARSANLRALAANALRGRTDTASRWRGYAESRVGYTDNVSLSPDSSLTGSSQQGSSLASLLVGGSAQVVGAPGNGLRINGSAFNANYIRFRTFNLSDLRLGAMYRHKWAEWRTGVGLNSEHLILGGDALETLLGVRADAGRDWNERNSARLIYRVDHIKGGRRFDHLTGQRQSLALENDWHVDRWRAVTGYRLEFNNRKDLDSGGEFFSVSPSRHRLYSDLFWEVAAQSTIHLGARMQKSRYDDPHQLLVNGTLTTQTRDDTLTAAELEYGFQITGDWSLGASYEYRRNRSAIDRYGYVSNMIGLSLAWSPE